MRPVDFVVPRDSSGAVETFRREPERLESKLSHHEKV